MPGRRSSPTTDSGTADLRGAIRGNVNHWNAKVRPPTAVAAQKALWSLQGQGGVWYCGAHFGAGFHEDGLQAGLAVAEALVPAPLSIGSLQVADGSSVQGFLCEPLALQGAADITHLGGWRAYLASTAPARLAFP